MEILLDYHILFMFLSIILFLLSVVLIFNNPTKGKCLTCLAFSIFNVVLAQIVSDGFLSIGFVSNGAVTDYSAMWMFSMLFFGIECLSAALALLGIVLFSKMVADEALLVNTETKKKRWRDEEL